MFKTGIKIKAETEKSLRIIDRAAQYRKALIRELDANHLLIAATRDGRDKAVRRNKELVTENQDLLQRLSVIKEFFDDLDQLIDSSDGAAGYHYDGSTSSWEEIMQGGWLTGLDNAKKAANNA